MENQKALGPDVWLMLECDPVVQKVNILGFKQHRDQQEAIKLAAERSQADGPIQVFSVNSDSFARNIYNWLRDCKLTRLEAIETVQEIGKAILSMK